MSPVSGVSVLVEDVLSHRVAAVSAPSGIRPARREGWPGEAEGLRISLAAAKKTVAQTDLTVRRHTTAIGLGMPSCPGITARAVTARATPATASAESATPQSRRSSCDGIQLGACGPRPRSRLSDNQERRHAADQ